MSITMSRFTSKITSKKTAVVAVIAAPAFIVGGIVGAAGASGRSGVEAGPATPVTVTVPGPVVTVKVPGPVITVKVPGPVKTVMVTRKAAPAPSLVTGIGQWEVGVDMPAGVYKVTAPVDPAAMCYWKITQTGKPEHIIANDIVERGTPSVTVKRGQDFTTEDCGSWARLR
jgi:hypothetical protein